ncbi:hypothetical protein [Ferrovibrio sp.]|uniref:hypothetical protein n=1 Tax=Ferrovibrio sp. TaxID=1917215 RepID=UPI00311E11FD
MPLFALVNRDGVILRHDSFAEAPALAKAKGLRWLPDNRPTINTQTQSIQRVEPVPADAAAITYNVAFVSDATLVQALRDEAYRRIVLIFNAQGNERDAIAKQRNLTAQAATLLRKGEANWTTDDSNAWAAGEALWGRVEAIRAASNTLEAWWFSATDDDRAGFDPSDDQHWPE